MTNSFVIARAPYRLSFFGGGTDYPAWYSKHPGAVLATAIDKYCWLSVRYLPPFFEHRNQIVWSEIERTKTVEEIRHPAVRETMKYLGMNGLEIHHAGDLPARSGMGTSSSFTVALVHALYALRAMKVDKLTLAQEAIHIEQDLVKEVVGSQDQCIAAFGGFNHIDFGAGPGGTERVKSIKSARVQELEQCLMLFFTGFQRTASDVAKEQVDRVEDNAGILSEMYAMVGDAEGILLRGERLADFGELLHESWQLKKRLSPNVSTEYIDYLYKSGREAGAVGGKLCGAGSGGFLLFFVEPDAQENVKRRLSSLLHVPFRFETGGSQIIGGAA